MIEECRGYINAIKEQTGLSKDDIKQYVKEKQEELGLDIRGALRLICNEFKVWVKTIPSEPKIDIESLFR